MKLIRVQSPDGTKRVELAKDSTVSQLYEKVFKEFSIDASRFHEWGIFADRNKTSQLSNSKRTHIHDLVSHGDMIYLMPAVAGASANASNDLANVQEDDVDVELAKQDGKIKRERDEQL